MQTAHSTLKFDPQTGYDPTIFGFAQPNNVNTSLQGHENVRDLHDLGARHREFFGQNRQMRPVQHSHRKTTLMRQNNTFGAGMCGDIGCPRNTNLDKIEPIQFHHFDPCLDKIG